MAEIQTQKKKRDSITVVLWALYLLFIAAGIVIIGRILYIKYFWTPDPAIVHQAMAAAPDVKLDEVLYIGDTNTDMQTGLNAGVRTAGVLWGFRTREELAAYHPWRIVSNARELTEAILNET